VGARWGVSGLLALVVLAVPHALNWQLQGQVHHGVVQLQPVAAQAGWQGTPPPADWVPAYEAANAMSHAGWVSPSGERVGVHVAYYRAQNYQRKLVSSTNVLVRSKDDAWTQVSSGSAVTELMGQALSVQRAELRAQGSVLNADLQRLVAWQFFWVDGRFTASPVKAKLFGAWQKFKGQGDDGAMVVIYTPTAHDSADAVLHNFVRDQGDALLAALRATQSRQ